MEDIHLGRGVFLNGEAMEDGVDALLENDGDVHALIQA